MVQSLGMRRWLSLQLAEQRGICMQCRFPLPRTFLDETLRALVPEMASPDAFAPELMTWKIHRALPGLLPRPEFAAVRAYAADGDPLKLYQLAERVAGLFDQYLVYRPAMLLEWERGDSSEEGDAAWQATLWRELNAARQLHFGAVLERLREGRLPAEARWPERVSIFGIASLPPAQMEVFLALAAHCPVHLFLLAPSREYHGDDLTPRQRARRGMAPTAEGNPLLTSLGKLHAQFVNVILEADEQAGFRIVNASEPFVEPTGTSLLHGLQREVLLAQNRGATWASEEPLEKAGIDRADASLQLHVCHSPMREIEVLYDQLLALLAEDPTLKPREILVMTPEIELYAPLIHAVFGCPEDPALRIPYSIADRQPRSDSPTISAFISILECVGKRCTAPEIFELLQTALLRCKFGFDDAGLARIRHWIHESGIRWGIDAAHRASLGLPASDEATWRRGIERLLLGYAMPGGNRILFEGILPQDDVEGSGAELLGRFVAAVEAIFSALETLAQPRPLGEWPHVLRAILDTFLAEAPGDEESHDALALRTALERLSLIAEQAGRDQIVEFAAMREHFVGLMGEAEQRGGFLTGGVTFCALKPMRSIPARVIWLLGMNEESFPRRSQPPQFDLISAQPKLGDRSVRDDDRYLFLEALLSARDRLRISHVGRSVIDHEVFPPSVVVSELLDYLDQSCAFPDAAKARQFLVFEHRLQAFSKSYFLPEGRLFSFSAANCAAAAAPRPLKAAPFFDQPLAEPDAELRNVELENLIAFFKSPAAYFLKRRLGVQLRLTDDTLEESEPLTPGGLGLYTVRNELFESRFAGLPLPSETAIFARAFLPPGSVGHQHYQAVERAGEALHSKFRSLIGTTRRDAPHLINLKLGPFTLTGRIESIYNGRLAFVRPAKLKPGDWLNAWLQHLAWCVASAAPPPPTLLAGEGEVVRFASQPADQLQALLEIYWRGLSSPLPFFPKSALEFVSTQGCKGKPPIERARAIWVGQMKTAGECEDPAFRLCFGGTESDTDPLDEFFEHLALAVFGPMLAASQPVEIS